MIVNNQVKYRSFASQNIFSYVINGNISNVTGESKFGISGDNGSINLFTFKTGSIYDVNNRHIWTYNPSENFIISGNVNTLDHNYYINNNIICLSTPKQNNIYKYFYISSFNASSDFNIFINGNTNPNYRIEFPFTNIIGDNITGLIYNNSNNTNSSFQFFSGKASQSFYSLNSLSSGFISGQKSGEIILKYSSDINPYVFSSGVNPIISLDGSFLFNTNFGATNYSFNIPVKTKTIYSVDLVTILTGTSYIYELITKSTQDQNVHISLINYTGHTGDLYYSGYLLTGLSSGISSSFIYGSDYITCISSGLGFSIDLDYSGKYVTGLLTGFTKTLQQATGLFTYYYNLPIGGGSGLSSGAEGAFFTGSGINSFTGLNLIYGSRLVTGYGSGLFTGYWFDLIQTGSGLLFNTNGAINYFTGKSLINNFDYSWIGVPYVGYDIENGNNIYNIFGITGSNEVLLTFFDSGVNNDKDTIFTNQITGDLCSKIFKLDFNTINNDISGAVFGSEDSYNLGYVFATNSDNFWKTNSSISTGFLGFEFKNFQPADSGIISYYEVILDKNFSNYKFLPLNLTLQGSNNFSTWSNLDTETNTNFYQSPSNIYQVNQTGNYNFIRLLITSGVIMPHINPNITENNIYGLGIKKINFYKKIKTISGLFTNLIDNNQSNNSFISVLNTGEQLYTSKTTGFGPFSNNYLFSGLNIFDNWTSINSSLNGQVQVATTKDSYIYLSTNSGATWSPGFALKKDWKGASLSFDGRVISAVAYNDKIYTSYDSGKNWNNYYNNINKWISIDIAYDGKNQIALLENSTNPIHVSYDSGKTWSGVNLTSLPPNAELRTYGNIAISKTGSWALSSNNLELYYSSNTGISWNVVPQIETLYKRWDKVALSSDGKIWGATAVSVNDFNNSNYVNRVWINNNYGNTNNWTTGNFYTGINFNDSILNSISLSFDGSKQAITTRRLKNTGDLFGTDGGIYISQNTGVSWFRSATSESGNLIDNFNCVSLSSGGNIFFASTSKEENYFFDKNNSSDIYKITNLDKNLFPYFETKKGSYIGYKTSKPYINRILTGFYIQFKTGYTPISSLTIDISQSGDKYTPIYTKISNNFSLIESGLFTSGANISSINNYQYFRFLFDTGTRGGFESFSPTLCYTGWELNTGSPINSYRSVSMSKNGQFIVAVGNSGSGSIAFSDNNPTQGVYTGLVYISNNYGNTWSVTKISGRSPGYQHEVKYNSVAIDKNTGKYILLSRGVYPGTYLGSRNPFTTGSWGAVALNYKIYLSTNSGSFFQPTGFDGNWNDVAISYDGRVMAAVGRNLNYTNPIVNGSFQISTNTGVSWTNVAPLLSALYPGGLFTGNIDLVSVTMSSGGNRIYALSSGGNVFSGDNFGSNWSVVYNGSSNTFYKEISTDISGKYITAIGSGIVIQSSDYGTSWSSINNLSDSISRYSSVSMSSSGNYQLILNSEGSCFKSNDFGTSWSIITGLSTGQTILGQLFSYQGCDISENGKYQILGNSISGGQLYSNCTYGSDVPINFIRIQNANFYLQNQNNYFKFILPDITGYGLCLTSGYGLASNLFYNPTGKIYQPAIFYQTGQITGITYNGTILIDNLVITGTGFANKVFLDFITGFKQATGLINFNTGLLSDQDFLTIKDYNFYYRTGVPNNNFEFNSLSGLINIFNSGSLGLLNNINPELVSFGITGYVNSNNSGITLFSYSSLGDDGNYITLKRNSENLNAIQIPNRYFRGGITMRPLLDNWTGIFSGDFYNFEAENSGIYTIISGPVNATAISSGIVFENNFDRNWTIKVTPISQGYLLNNALTNIIPYNTLTKTFSGIFTIKSGLTYMGYSGLNIQFYKKPFIHPNNTGNIAKYIISGLNNNSFLFTGLIGE